MENSKENIAAINPVGVYLQGDRVMQPLSSQKRVNREIKLEDEMESQKLGGGSAETKKKDTERPRHEKTFKKVKISKAKESQSKFKDEGADENKLDPERTKQEKLFKKVEISREKKDGSSHKDENESDEVQDTSEEKSVEVEAVEEGKEDEAGEDYIKERDATKFTSTTTQATNRKRVTKNVEMGKTGEL